jgi:hypothetical protein
MCIDGTLANSIQKTFFSFLTKTIKFSLTYICFFNVLGHHRLNTLLMVAVDGLLKLVDKPSVHRKLFKYDKRSAAAVLDDFQCLCIADCSR